MSDQTPSTPRGVSTGQTSSPRQHEGWLRAVRPILLGTLLAGMLLTLLVAPSALQAQEGAPPGTAPPSGYGAAPSQGTVPARQVALIAQAGGGSAIWWLVAGVFVVILLLGAATLYLRQRA